MNIEELLKNVQFDYNSPVIITYLLLSVIACILNAITRGRTNKHFFSSYRSSLLTPLTYIRLVTHSIGHKDWGSINLIIMLVITSIVIALFNTIFNNYIITGASGNVYMLIVLSSFSNITEGKIPLTLILILIFYIISEVKKSIMEGNKKTYHDGHLIGAICGIIFGFYFL